MIRSRLILLIVVAIGWMIPAADSVAQPTRQLTAAQQAELQRAKSLDEQADQLFGKGNYPEAVAVAKQVVEIRQRVLPNNDSLTILSICRLADIYRVQGDANAAEPLYQQALAAAEKLGPNQLLTADCLNNLGMLYQDQAKYTAAEPLYQRSLKIVEKALGPYAEPVAARVNNLAELDRLQGKYAQAEPLYLRAIKILETVSGQEHPGVAICVSNLGVVYEAQGKRNDAERSHRKALALREKALGLDHPDTAKSLNNLATFLVRQAQFAEAEQLLQRSLKIVEKKLPPNHPARATAFNNLANLSMKSGKYDAAEDQLKAAIEIFQKSLGRNHPETAIGYFSLGDSYRHQAKYEEAEKQYQQSLEIFERNFGPDHVFGASCHNNLALVYQDQGDYARAESECRRALKIWQSKLGEEHPDTAKGYGNLASILEHQGKYAMAEESHLRAVSIAERVNGLQHPTRAIYLGNLANVQYHLGKWPQALANLQQALSIQEKALSAGHPAVAVTLHNLGEMYAARGDFAAAESAYLRASEINEKAHGSEHPSLATTMASLASIYLERGQLDEASFRYDRSLAIMTKLLGAEHPDTLIIRSNRCSVYDRRREFVKSEPIYREVLQVQERVLGRIHPGTNLVRSKLAFVLAALDQREAGAQFDAARRAAREFAVQVLPWLSEKEQSHFLVINDLPHFHCALTYALLRQDDPESARLSAAWVLNGKGIAGETLARNNLLLRDLRDPQKAAVVEELQRTRRKLAQLAMSKSRGQDRSAWDARWQELEAQEQKLAQQFRPADQPEAGREGDWIELKAVQQALPARSVLVEIVRFRVANIGLKPNQPARQPARYVAWVMSRDAEQGIRMIDLGSADEIDKLVSQVREQVAQPGQPAIDPNVVDFAQEFTPEMQALAARIWQPLAEVVGDAEEVLLSPDGALWLAPWSALPVGKVKPKFLLEKHALRLVVNARDLAAPKAPQGEARPPAIFANPLFDQPAAQKQSSIQAIFKQLPPGDDAATRSITAKSILPKVSALPGTAAEAAAIQPSLESLTSQKATLYTQHYALESVAKKLVRPRIALFATHGFFLPVQEGRQEALLTQPDSSPTLDAEGKPIENPLLRCGLLLAGCNQRDATVGGDDGILTGLEIVGIDFRGTELIVLSACETGIGDIRNGDGVAGLRQAFQLAGAQSVVASLWQVPDRDSALIMNDFFANLADGQAKATALRNAQRKRIEARRDKIGGAHPFFWAAWTVTDSSGS